MTLSVPIHFERHIGARPTIGGESCKSGGWVLAHIVLEGSSHNILTHSLAFLSTFFEQILPVPSDLV